MKKIVSTIAIFLAIFMISLTVNIYAVALGSIDITTTKQLVHPNETVTVDIDFGEELGSYTFDIAYDNNLFEYVSSEGVTSADDNGTRVRAYFFDSTGGSNPRSNMSVTFKAKDVLTSNPTDFSITAEGLANPDASVSYDDISVPIVKNITVEPKYVDYDIKLNYTGDIIKNKEKDMKLVVSSSMGKNYEHTRIIAEATTPTGGTVKLLATDSQNLEHDIIQSGWGDVAGDAIGGKDVVKELAVRGLFDTKGDYAITFKLINRDDSDAEIATKTVNITVKEKETTTVPPTNNENNNQTQKPTENKPSTMPQTGNTVYWYMIPIITVLVATFILLKKKD